MMNTELPLRDIHLPDPISWWPLAPGWWLTGAVFLLVVGLVIVMMRRKWRPNLKTQASKALEAIDRAFQETKDAKGCLVELSAFLRRVVLSQKESEKSAGLTGEAWLRFLDEPLKTPEFSQGIGQLLLSGPYQASVEHEQVSQLIQLCRQWVKHL